MTTFDENYMTANNQNFNISAGTSRTGSAQNAAGHAKKLVRDSLGNWTVRESNDPVKRNKENTESLSESGLTPAEIERKKLTAQIRKQVKRELKKTYLRDIRKAYNAGHSDSCYGTYAYGRYAPDSNMGKHGKLVLINFLIIFIVHISLLLFVVTHGY